MDIFGSYLWIILHSSMRNNVFFSKNSWKNQLFVHSMLIDLLYSGTLSETKFDSWWKLYYSAFSTSYLTKLILQNPQDLKFLMYNNRKSFCCAPVRFVNCNNSHNVANLGWNSVIYWYNSYENLFTSEVSCYEVK